MDARARPHIDLASALDGLLLAVLVGGLASLSLSLARMPGTQAVVWIGNGVLVGWLLSRPTARWPLLLALGFAGELLARYCIGGRFALEASVAACNLVEVLIVASLVRRRVPDLADPRGWVEVGAVASASALLACAVSGLLVASLRLLVYGQGMVGVFLVWYSVHVVGLVVFATLVTVLRNGGFARARMPRRRMDLVASMALLATISIGVFAQGTYPLLFLTFPPLLLGAFRHRFPGVVIGVSLLAIIGIAATLEGSGPLAATPGHAYGAVEQVVLLQLFVGAACLLTFPAALVVAERGRLMGRMRDSEARYRMLADHSSDLVMRLDGEGRRVYVSPSAREILGREPDELLGADLDFIHPDDRAERQRVFDVVKASGELAVLNYRVKHADHGYICLEAIVRPLPGTASGESQGLIVAARDVSARVAAEQALAASRHELEKLVRIDSLTGLANRRQLDERLALAITRSRRQVLPVALMYLDVDHFKQVNDSLGHAAGDTVLRAFANRLLHNVRAGDLVARLGGDEFVVLVEDAAMPASAEIIARKLIATMATPIDADGTAVAATTSIGIAYTNHASDAQALMAAADRALYAAKGAGRNTYRMFDVDLDAPPG